MGKVVEPSDFSDEDLKVFLKDIERVNFKAQDVPDWVLAEAEAFAAENNKPEPGELRALIGATVNAAMGWDEPDDRRAMLHGALKAYYLTSWLDHLHRGKHRVDLTKAYRVAFTPIFGHE